MHTLNVDVSKNNESVNLSEDNTGTLQTKIDGLKQQLKESENKLKSMTGQLSGLQISDDEQKDSKVTNLPKVLLGFMTEPNVGGTLVSLKEQLSRKKENCKGNALRESRQLQQLYSRILVFKIEFITELLHKRQLEEDLKKLEVDPENI